MVVDPDNSHLFAAMGAALVSENTCSFVLDELIDKLENVFLFILK